MNYGFYFNQTTPQTQSIPGKTLVRGRSGGMAFEADVWQQLRRCLLIGTNKSTYYAGKRELTGEFIEVVKKAIALDPAKVASEINYASDGHSINNSAPLFALVLLSADVSKEAKTAFKELFPQVVRTASHFYEWLSYTKQMRGMGRLVKEAGLSWLSKKPKALAYQLLKYQQRNGYSSHDVLRLFKPTPATNEHQTLFNWIVKGWDELPDLEDVPSELQQLWWFEYLKRNPNKGVTAIHQGRLTHEMVSGIARMTPEVWQELFNSMPMTALLRNLGSLTEIGIVRFDKAANLDLVEQRLNNKDLLRSTRIHPIDVLKALKSYSGGGSLGRSQKTWSPVPRVVDILDKALNLSFETQDPTGKVFMHAIDISGSMSSTVSGGADLACCEVAATMALATAKAERNYIIRGFSHQFIDLGITLSDTFSNAVAKTRRQNFGSTDASLAYQWARQEKVHVDVFCTWTDNESFAGYQHPTQALMKYRAEVNPNAKAVYISLAPYNITQVDPSDPYSYDIAGFDPSTPKVIQMIAEGEL
jgi:60 kDa SS-A/Ro ribonucleoprotein